MWALCLSISSLFSLGELMETSVRTKKWLGMKLLMNKAEYVRKQTSDLKFFSRECK